MTGRRTTVSLYSFTTKFHTNILFSVYNTTFERSRIRQSIPLFSFLYECYGNDKTFFMCIAILVQQYTQQQSSLWPLGKIRQRTFVSVLFRFVQRFETVGHFSPIVKAAQGYTFSGGLQKDQRKPSTFLNGCSKHAQEDGRCQRPAATGSDQG